jgi:hypothetical protein
MRFHSVFVSSFFGERARSTHRRGPNKGLNKYFSTAPSIVHRGGPMYILVYVLNNNR